MKKCAFCNTQMEDETIHSPEECKEKQIEMGMNASRNTWKNMSEQTGNNQSFPEQAMYSFMQQEAERIANEPPGTLVVCCCCGNYETNVNILGYCPWCWKK